MGQNLRTNPTKNTIQRACKGNNWNYEYDGCSLSNFLANVMEIDKDNPASGSDTHFSKINQPGNALVTQPLRNIGNYNPNAGFNGSCDIHDWCY